MVHLAKPRHMRPRPGGEGGRRGRGGGSAIRGAGGSAIRHAIRHHAIGRRAISRAIRRIVCALNIWWEQAHLHRREAQPSERRLTNAERTFCQRIPNLDSQIRERILARACRSGGIAEGGHRETTRRVPHGHRRRLASRPTRHDTIDILVSAHNVH